VLNGRESVELVMKTVSGYAYFLPEALEVNGRLEPSERKRGIYTTHVYSASMSMSGRFARPDFSFLEFPDLEPQWKHARVCFAVSDLRGARGSVPLNWNGADVPTEPGALFPGFANGMHALVELDPEGGDAEFSLELTLNGSSHFSVVPTGRETVVHLDSPWADPSFDGAYLPVNREISLEGFNAEWQVSYLGRGFPQRWSDRSGTGGITEAHAQASAFGVTLLDTVTPYRTVERSIKYGVLFIVLAFATFFLFETTCAVRLNALNYLLVGAALCLFYLGLLALSEFLVFALAYGIAAVISVALIGFYSRSILKSVRRAWIVSAMLGGVYAYLYFVVQLEDFALLAGTGALFATLAALMFFTRRFDGTGIAPAKR
jgi:inner membrane protein